MINLLPPEVREQTLYARRNTVLMRWSIALAISIICLCLLFATGVLFIKQSSSSQASAAEKTREELRVQKLEETQNRVNEISGNLNLALQVLQRKILFSGIVQQIASAIPYGASLTDLRISKLQGGIDLEFEATDYQTATQVQVNLQDKANKIFEKADIVSINCSGTPEDSRYPCQITIRALFAKDNPYAVVSGSQSGGSQ